MDVLNDLSLIPDLPPVVALMLGDDETLEAFRDSTKPEFPASLVDVLDFFQFIGESTKNTS